MDDARKTAKKGIRRFTKAEIRKRYKDKHRAELNKKRTEKRRLDAAIKLASGKLVKPHQYRLHLFIPRISANERYKTNEKYRNAAKKRARKRAILKREEVNAYKQTWSKNKQANDPVYKLSVVIRRRVSMAFKAKKYTKQSSCHSLLGCDYAVARAHIENMFKDGMTWENHGLWHIDHIVPIASATSYEELVSLFNYKNLQPLWAKENMSKGRKIL